MYRAASTQQLITKQALDVRPPILRFRSDRLYCVYSTMRSFTLLTVTDVGHPQSDQAIIIVA